MKADMSKYIPHQIIEQAKLNKYFMREMFDAGKRWLKYQISGATNLDNNNWMKLEVLNFSLQYYEIIEETEMSDTKDNCTFAIAAWMAGKRAYYDEMDKKDREQAGRMPWSALMREYNNTL